MPDKTSPFRNCRTGPEIISLAVMLYIRFPPSLRNVEDLHHERGIHVCHEAVRFRWNRFGSSFASEIRKKRASRMRANKMAAKYKKPAQVGIKVISGTQSALGIFA